MSAKNQKTPADLMTVNEDAERSVVSALARFGAKDPAGAAALILKNGIDPDLFVTPDIRAAYVAVADLLADGIPPTAATISALPHNKSALVELETVLSCNVSATSNLPVYVKILKRCRTERQLQDHRQRLKQAIEAGRPAVDLAELTERIAALEHRTDELAQIGATTKMRVCDTAMLRTAKMEPPKFIVHPLIPRGHLTLFGGHGGSGKTTVSFVVAAHVAAGKDFAGLAIQQGKVLIASFEDGQDLILWRLKNIIEEYQLDFDAVAANLTVIDATESTAIMSEAVHAGIRHIVLTKDGADLAEHIRQQQYDLVIVDNASDAFCGNENDRQQVRQFVRQLAKTVSAHNGAILLLAHIDKSAARNGANGNSYSGSTGWHNSARSRLALIDNELRQEKLNVGKAMPDPIPLVWTDRAVPIPADSDGAQLVQSIADQQDDFALLACFDVAASLGDTVPAAKTRQTAYQLFIAYPELPKHLRDDRLRFQKGMTRLLRAGSVREETYRNADRKEKTRLVRVIPD